MIADPDHDWGYSSLASRDPASSTTNVTVIMLAERIYQRVYAS